LGELLLNLQQHCRDILLQEPKPGVQVPTLWTLARETLPKDKEGRTRTDASAGKKLDKLHADLARTVLTGLDYPQSLLPIVLDRFRSERRLTSARLGLVKGCINRHRRVTAVANRRSLWVSTIVTTSPVTFWVGFLRCLKTCSSRPEVMPDVTSRRSATGS
jgi:hypothetical protein